MGRKDTLAMFMATANKRFPYYYNFTPKTFLVPQDYTELMEDMKKCKDTDQMYIYKPALGARGNGICILSPEDPLPSTSVQAVVQQYIMNPLLLHGYKFDLRIYVLITSVDPLIFYIYDQGLGRFATEKFVPPDESNKENTQMHLTNFSVNYQSENFVDGDKVLQQEKEEKERRKQREKEEKEKERLKHADTESSQFGTSSYTSYNAFDDSMYYHRDNFPSKWKLRELFHYLDENREVFEDSPDSIINNIPEEKKRGYPVKGLIEKELYKRVSDVITKTIIAVEPRMHSSSEKAGTLHSYPRRNFGLYGADIMFDALGNPYLIEINSSPATGTATELDVEIKFELLHDVMNLVGVEVNLDDDQKIICPTSYSNSEEARMARQLGIALNPKIKEFTLGENERVYSMSIKGL